jgi:transposase
MSKRLKVKLFDDFFSIPISVGTLSKAEKIVSAALEQPVAEAHQYVKAQNAVHSDETSHKRSGGKMWMWLAVAALVAVFMIRTNRDTLSAQQLLGKNFRGIVISDRYSAYNWLEITRRQLCWAHLKRDFTKISERSGEPGQIGEQLLACTNRLFRLWHMTCDGNLSRSQFSKSTEPIIAITERLLKQGTTCEESKTAGTCKRLLKQKAALWTFIEVEGVEPTNNLAEQTIRFYVMWRKLSYGTQSERGDRFVERVLTATATCRLQNRDSLEYMTAAVSAYLKGESSPSLLPNLDEPTPVKLAA